MSGQTLKIVAAFGLGILAGALFAPTGGERDVSGDSPKPPIREATNSTPAGTSLQSREAASVAVPSPTAKAGTAGGNPDLPVADEAGASGSTQRSLPGIQPPAIEVRASSLPEVYTPLVQAPRPANVPRRLRTDEHFDIFLTEARDEAWAYTMETGIQDFWNQNQAGHGNHIESLECRSTYCMLAGYVDDGYPDVTDELIDAMRQRGWWDLSSSSSTSGGLIGGQYRFVILIPRYPEQ